MRRWVLGGAFGAVLAIAAGCTSTKTDCPTTPSAPSTPPTSTMAIAPPGAVMLGSPSPSRLGSACFRRGLPAPIETNAKDEPEYCGRLDAREVARTEARVHKEFVIRDKPSKLVIDFGCAVAFGALHEVIFEDGSGHGGSLRIARFVREAGRVTVRMIDSAHYTNPHIDVRVADVDAVAFDAMMASARVDVLVKPHVVRLTEPGTGKGTSTYSSSTNDFHLRLTFVDEDAHITDRSFTGYESSRAQESILPMRIASEPVQKLLAATTFATVAPTDDDRAFFTRRLAVTTAGTPVWWVKERYVAIAAELGSTDALPSLVTILRDSVAGKGGPSGDRTRDAVLEAITKISGWDPRLDATGAVRPNEVAAAAAIEECSR